MKSVRFLAKKIYSDLFNFKLFLIAATTVLYDCYLLFILKDYKISRGEYVLYCVTDQYFITYFFILMLSWNVLHILSGNDDLWKLRMKNKISYYTGTLFGIAGNVATILVFHIVAAIILGGVFENKNAFLTYEYIDTLTEYPKYFSTPISAIACSVIYFFIGIMLWIFLLQIICQMKNSKKMLIFWLISYLSMIFGSHFLENIFLEISLDKWLILYFVLDHREAMYVAQVILFAGLIATLFWKKINRKLEIQKLRNVLRWEKRELYTKKNFLMLAVIIILNLGSLEIFADNETFLDSLMSLFIGVSNGRFALIDFIRMLMINISPIYLIAAYIQKQIVEENAMVQIRTSNLCKLVCRFWVILEFLFLYVGMYLILLLLMCLLQGKSLSGFGCYQDIFDFPINTLQLCFSIGIYRLLELLAATLIIWLCAILWKNAVIGLCIYIFSGVTYFSEVALFSIMGISNMATYGYLYEETLDRFQRNFMCCLTAVLVLFCIIYMVTVRRRRQKNE